MKVFEAYIKDGRIFRVILKNDKQLSRYTNLVQKSIGTSHEIYNTKVLVNGIHDIKQFEDILSI